MEFIMSFSSNSVIAKARAIYGRSLTAEDYSQLCSRATVAEAAAFLKQTERYSKALSGINPQTVHRGQLESLLSKAVFDVFERFHSFDFSDSRVFFRYIIMQLEADQIINAIEGVEAGTSDRYIASLPMFLVKHADTDLITLGNARTYLDIAQLLENTPFAKPLRPLLIDAAENGSININECERRLYTLYYMSALRTAEKTYSGKTLNELKRALLKSIDMENVVSCCRMRAFGVSSETVRKNLLPFKYRLNSDTIDRLLQHNDMDRIEQELSHLGYHTDRNAEFSSIEQLTDLISMDHLRRTMRMSRNSAAVYYSLIECLKIEQRNVKTAIEGIRYGLSSGEILSMLVI